MACFAMGAQRHTNISLFHGSILSLSMLRIFLSDMKISEDLFSVDYIVIYKNASSSKFCGNYAGNICALQR